MAFLNNLINGISLGSVYAIIALGYTMVYGIAKMLNFAHGDIIMVGAYVCFFAVSEYGLNPALGIIIAIAICTVLGIIIERLAYNGYRRKLFSAECGAAYVDVQPEDLSRHIRQRRICAVRRTDDHPL